MVTLIQDRNTVRSHVSRVFEDLQRCPLSPTEWSSIAQLLLDAAYSATRIRDSLNKMERPYSVGYDARLDT